MGNFDRGNRSRGNFGRRSFGRDRDGGRPQMHKVICSSCQKECEVPFRPTGDRPVYCSECFEKNGGGNERKSFGRDNRDNDRRGFNQENRGQSPSNEQFRVISSKLDQILKLLKPNEVSQPAHIGQPEIIIKKKRAPKKAEAPVEASTETNISPETPKSQ